MNKFFLPLFCVGSLFAEVKEITITGAFDGDHNAEFFGLSFPIPYTTPISILWLNYPNTHTLTAYIQAVNQYPNSTAILTILIQFPALNSQLSGQSKPMAHKPITSR